MRKAQLSILLLILVPVMLRAAPRIPVGFKGRYPFFFQNAPFSCMLASGKMVIATLTGRLARESYLHSQSRMPSFGGKPGQASDPYGPSHTGTQSPGIVRALRMNGIQAELHLNASVEDIASWTKKDGPVIAAIDDDTTVEGSHAIVVDGFPAGGSMVAIRDPWFGKIRVPVEAFRKVYLGEAIRSQRTTGNVGPEYSVLDDREKRHVEEVTLLKSDYRILPGWPYTGAGAWDRAEALGLREWAARLAPYLDLAKPYVSGPAAPVESAPALRQATSPQVLEAAQPAPFEAAAHDVSKPTAPRLAKPGVGTQTGSAPAESVPWWLGGH